MIETDSVARARALLATHADRGHSDNTDVEGVGAGLLAELTDEVERLRAHLELVHEPPKCALCDD
jgi:hypothetical protein